MTDNGSRATLGDGEHVPEMIVMMDLNNSENTPKTTGVYISVIVSVLLLLFLCY